MYRYVGNRATLATDPSGNIAFISLVLIAAPLLGFGLTAGYTGIESYRSTGSAFNGQIWGAYGDGLEQIYQRNLEKYGDKLGPTIDYLRSKGKT